MKKVDVTNSIWSTAENQKLAVFIKEFRLNPSVESDIFQEITELIWQDGVCYPIFFAAIPYLIEIASNLEIEASKDLWNYLGCWISTHKKYRCEVSKEVLECFDLSLKCAEEACIKQIISVEKLEETDAQYLYASLFAFAGHRLGYMTMSGYKDDFAGTSVTECKNGHLNDVTVYNSGIVAYEEEEKPCNIVKIDVNDIPLKAEKDNKWQLLEGRIQRGIDNKNTSKEVRSHLELAKMIISKGVTSRLSIKYAFSLYGSLLYCNGSVEAAMRAFHGWDEIACIECGEKFVFADGWCDDKW